MAKHSWWMAWLARSACVVALSSTALVGCGGDDDGGDEPEPDAGGPDGGGAGGAGGAGGGGAGGTGGSAATAVPCGDATCTATDPLMGLGATFGLPAPVACCVDEAASTCGMVDMSGMCAEPAPAPTPDPTCPGVTAAGMMMSGCCIDGQCGVDGSIFGMGCVENAAAAQQIMAIPAIGGFIMIPPAQACGGGDPDGGTDADGGS